MNKRIIIVIIILVSVLVILGLYQTFALGGTITTEDNSYTVTADEWGFITVPGNSSKTVYYRLTNTNNGTVRYGVGYSGSSVNINVKYYYDTTDPVTGTVDYGESKFIKLYIENNDTEENNVFLTTILGYENGGDLIVPSWAILITEEKKNDLATYITNLYNNSTTTPVVNNSVTYQYDTTNSLMKDVGNNIRYYGANPNNYVYFNCTDYSNQSSSTCELWRIIGVFDGKVKLMRNETIGEYSWDTMENGDGINDWTNAKLMKLLNPGYESETNGGSLYYNSKDGNCYNDWNNATTACNFTSTGIKNETTRNIIADTNWFLNSYEGDFEEYANQIYEYERATENLVKWTGKIALAYSSDYGYAADLGKCSKALYSYNDSTCTTNNWMKTIFTTNNNGGWLLNPGSNLDPSFVWYIDSSGFAFGVQSASSSHLPYNIIPNLYLNPDVSVLDGSGTSSDPYRLSVN